MPRLGPGQSGPAPKRPAPKPAAPAPRYSKGRAAAGGAVLARGTYQPSNRKQQAELSQGVRQASADQQRQRAKQQLLTAYNRASYLREQARQAGAGRTVALLDRRLSAMQPHLEASGAIQKPRGIEHTLAPVYNALEAPIRTAEKVPVVGQLAGMVDPGLLAKTAVKNVRSLPGIGRGTPVKASSVGEAIRKGAPVNAAIVGGKAGRIRVPEADLGKVAESFKFPTPERLRQPGPEVPKLRGRAQMEKRLAKIDAANAKIAKGLRDQPAGLQALQAGRNMTKAGRRGPTVTQQLEQHAQTRLSNFLERNPEHPVAKAYIKREAEAERLRDLLNAPEDVLAVPKLEHLYEHGAKILPQAQADLERAAKASGAGMTKMSLKPRASAEEKVAAHGTQGTSRVRDIVRGRLIVKDADQMRAALTELKKTGRVVGIKNAFTKSVNGGYRDVKVFTNHQGHIVETQLSVPEIVAEQVKQRPLYEEMRTLERQGKVASPRFAELEQKMRAGYDAAYAKYQERVGALAAVRSLSKAEREIGLPLAKVSVQEKGRGLGPSQARATLSAAETGKSSTSKSFSSGRGEVKASSTQLKIALGLPDEPAAEAAAAAAAREKVRGSLGTARRLRAEQKKLYSAERGRRVGEAERAVERAGGGVEGFKAGMSELKGELPKTKFDKLREGRLSQDELESLFRDVWQHRDLQFFEKVSTQKALLDSFQNGRTPTPSEIAHLKTVFGSSAAEEIARISGMRRAGKLSLEALNIPRAFMASADISAPFRQGLILGTAHPVIFAKNFKPMFKAFKSEDFYQATQQAIHEDPNFPLAQEGGLAVTDIGAGPGAQGAPEPYVYAGLAEKVPGAGHVVKASERAYSGFLNKFRMDVFNNVLETARSQGKNVEDPKFLKGVSNYINAASGRGDLRGAESWAPFLNAALFSPRLAASRLNFLDPTWYLKLYHQDPYAAKLAVRNMVQFTGVMAGILGLASAAGYKVGTDPRSADFGKIRMGNTRVDIMGGLQQDVRLFSQLISGKVVSSTTGKTITLGPGFGNLSRWDIAERFVTGKFAPVPSILHDIFKGTGFASQPLTVQAELYQHLTPLVAQDAIDLFHGTKSLPAAIAGYAVGATGIGLQTYGPKDLTKQTIDRNKTYGQEILKGAIQTHLLPAGSQLTPELKKAIANRSARYANRAKMGATDTRSNFTADVTFLEQRGLVTKPQGDKAIAWAKSTKRDYLVQRELARLNGWYFNELYNNALTDARQKLRERGYDLPRPPR